jgi:hypothetical protein
VDAVVYVNELILLHFSTHLSKQIAMLTHYEVYTTWLSIEKQLVPFITGSEDTLHSNNHQSY